MRATRPYTYLGTVQGMCRECGTLVPARVLEEDGAVYQERLCPKCGSARVRLADNVGWYLTRSATTVHCKPFSHAKPDALIGEDELPWKDIFHLCETIGNTEWYIVEYERPNVPALEAVEKCLRAMKQMGR